MDNQKILSIGIDVGTSTTQLVVSELEVENTASLFNVPKINIINKKIIKRSDVHFTPLLSSTEIDSFRLKQIISNEFNKLKLSKEDISTGAIILTGETSRKDNAEKVSHELSEFAGDFVVATAGPDLESIISGKGSGCESISKLHPNKVFANLDIGGGTTNLSLFKDGELLSVGCYDIGGRLIKVKGNKISYISKKIKQLLELEKISLNVDDAVDCLILDDITSLMSNALFSLLTHKTDKYNFLITNKNIDNIKIDSLTLSGGVGECIYNSNYEDFQFGDIGVLLGKSIKGSTKLKAFEIFEPEEKIRATVIGAGSHTTEISGSTIFYSDSNLFPIKNIPIINTSAKKLQTHQLSSLVRNYNLINNTVAISISTECQLSFSEVQTLADDIIMSSKEIIEIKQPLFIIIDSDYAKVIGQTIYTKLNCNHSVICIDSVSVEHGNYIDIGEPIANGMVLPVVVKTLIFDK